MMKERIDLDGLVPALHAHAVDAAQRDPVMHGGGGRLGEQDIAAIELVHALEARGEVDVVADRGVIEEIRGSHVAHDRRPGIDADPHAYRWPPRPLELLA